MCALFYENVNSNGYAKQKRSPRKYEHCEFIHPACGYLHIDMHLYLHALWLLAAVYVGSIAFSIARGIGGCWNGRMERYYKGNGGME